MGLADWKAWLPSSFPLGHGFFRQRRRNRHKNLLCRSIAIRDRSDETVSLSGNGLHEARLLRIIPKNRSDLADGRVDSVFGVDEDIVAPQASDDFLSCDEIAFFLNQQDEQLHWEFFELDAAASAEKLVAVAIELKFVEFDGPGRQSSRHFLGAEYSTGFLDRKEVAYFQAVPASPDIHQASPLVHCSAPVDSG